jgi:hypothetical protein
MSTSSISPKLQSEPYFTSDSRSQPVSALMPSKALKLREARFQDYSQVVALTRKFHLQADSYEGWTHLWTNNPTCREMNTKFPIGWVLETGSEEVVGYLGNIPLSYQFEGRRITVATTRSWVVDTSYRAYSPLLLATYFQQENVDLFLNTSVNSQAAPAYDSFQGIRVPVGHWNRTLFWVTNYQGFAESLLRKKGWITVKPLTFPLSAFLFLRDHLKKSRFYANRSTAKVVPCACFDDRFDAFWETLREKKVNRLLAVRSRELLEWHFKFALLQNAAWIYIIEENSRLAAYSVFLRQDGPEAGLTRVRLADFQCLDENKAPTMLAAMLQLAIDRCRQESIHMFELIGLPPWLEKEVERASPLRRPLLNWLYFYKANDRLLGAKLKSPAVWEPSLFDGDSTL